MAVALGRSRLNAKDQTKERKVEKTWKNMEKHGKHTGNCRLSISASS